MAKKMLDQAVKVLWRLIGLMILVFIVGGCMSALGIEAKTGDQVPGYFFDEEYLGYMLIGSECKTLQIQESIVDQGRTYLFTESGEQYVLPGVYPNPPSGIYVYGYRYNRRYWMDNTKVWYVFGPYATCPL